MKSLPLWCFFWSVFSCTQTEYRKVRTRKKSVFGQFSRSDGPAKVRSPRLFTKNRQEYCSRKLPNFRILQLYSAVRYKHTAMEMWRFIGNAFFLVLWYNKMGGSKISFVANTEYQFLKNGLHRFHTKFLLSVDSWKQGLLCSRSLIFI